MVTVAGGVPALGREGEKSWRVDWDEVRASAPDVVVCAPCGYDLAGAIGLAGELKRAEVLPGLPIWAVDANASFARPGPRLVDGIEALAGILHGVPVNPRVTGLAHRLT
jgi:iron complex transport system substrate-binding protein